MYTIRKLINGTGRDTVENGENSITAEISSDVIPEQLKCPICFDVPAAEIYQCLHGHIICSSCKASIQNCPQCRIPFEVDNEFIRVRALESFLDLVAVPCPHQSGGCQKSVSRRIVKKHVKNCIFNGKCVQLCKSLGNDCDFWTNGLNASAALRHFQKEHKAQGPISLEECGSVEIVLTTLGVNLLENDGVWTPVTLSLQQDQFMVLTLFNKSDNSVSWVCLELSCDEVQPSWGKYEVEFLIKSKSGNIPQLKWRVPTVPLLYSNEIIECPGNRMPISLLEKFYFGYTNMLKVKVSVISPPPGPGTEDRQRSNIDQIKSEVILIENINVRSKVTSAKPKLQLRLSL